MSGWLYRIPAESGRIGEFAEKDIRLLTNTIIAHAYRNRLNEEKERMMEIMGGNVIETEASIIWDAGRKEGIEQGKAEGKTEGKTEGADQFAKALTLLRNSECVSVQDLIDKDIDGDIAEMAIQFYSK